MFSCQLVKRLSISVWHQHYLTFLSCELRIIHYFHYNTVKAAAQIEAVLRSVPRWNKCTRSIFIKTCEWLLLSHTAICRVLLNATVNNWAPLCPTGSLLLEGAKQCGGNKDPDTRQNLQVRPVTLSCWMFVTFNRRVYSNCCVKLEVYNGRVNSRWLSCFLKSFQMYLHKEANLQIFVWTVESVQRKGLVFWVGLVVSGQTHRSAHPSTWKLRCCVPFWHKPPFVPRLLWCAAQCEGQPPVGVKLRPLLSSESTSLSVCVFFYFLWQTAD